MGRSSDVRAAVEQAGGRLEITVRELRDSYGLSRLTAKGRASITEDLRRAKLRLEPPLEGLGLDSRVTVVDVSRKARKQARSAATAPAAPTATAVDPWAAANRRFSSTPPRREDGSPTPYAGPAVLSAGRTNRRRRLVGGGVIAVVIVVVLAAIFGGGDSDNAPEPDAGQTPAVGPDSSAAASQSRNDAVAYLEEAKSAIANDDTDQALARLSEIDEDTLAEAPGLARQVKVLRHRAGLTSRYIDATNLAASGSYLVARQRMLALVPFRDAAVQANEYATLAARKLVFQAREAYRSRPGRALDLLDRAENLAPGLAAIDQVRGLAEDRQIALAAPPEPVAPAQPAAPSCNPNYSGACIPNAPYDLNCPDVAAVNFASVGSDPYGFDGDGDGVGCED